MTRLTLRRLEAIQEALIHRLAGEIEPDCPKIEDYDAALTWVSDEIRKRMEKKIGPDGEDRTRISGATTQRSNH